MKYDNIPAKSVLKFKSELGKIRVAAVEYFKSDVKVGSKRFHKV